MNVFISFWDDCLLTYDILKKRCLFLENKLDFWIPFCFITSSFLFSEKIFFSGICELFCSSELSHMLSVKVPHKLKSFSIMILFSLGCSSSEITDSFIKQTSTYLMRFFPVSIEFDYIFLTQLSTDKKKLNLSRLHDFDQSWSSQLFI